MNDVELLRLMMLMLEERQVSPRQTIVISLLAEAEAMHRTVEEIADGFDRLLAIDYIDGPGWEDGFFLFRKLTRRGTQFVQAARRPRDWDRIKKQYAASAASP